MIQTAKFTTDELFESAVSIIRNLPKDGPFKPSDDLKLRFYAYFKQATHGPNDTSKPRFYQIVEWYKWDAWNKLGDMSKTEAKERYISELKQVMDSIPISDDENPKYFEGVLGWKFYDYWLKRRYRDRREERSSIDVFSQDQQNEEEDEKSARRESKLVETSSSPLILTTTEYIPVVSFFHSLHKKFNWFNVLWPFFVYVLMRRLERRRQK